MSKVKCPNCGTEIDVDDIITKDIKSQVIVEEQVRHLKGYLHFNR